MNSLGESCAGGTGSGFFAGGAGVPGTPTYTAGGRALGYYASVRLDLRPLGPVRDSGQVVGSRIRVQVTKNKVAPAWQVAELEVNAALADGIRRVATALARRGFKKGDVFAIYSPNLPEYAVIFNAVAMLGGINTTVNPLYTAGELANQLRDCRARFLITVPPILDKAKEAAAAAVSCSASACCRRRSASP